MVAQQFLDYLSKFQVGNYVGVEDFADKFNFLFTVILLLLCTIVVAVKQYILKPISCYISTDPGGFNVLEYTENYCWIEGTVPLTYDGRIPETEPEWDELNKKKILYYQWVPFVLALQCLMFHTPRLIWQIFCYNYTGTDLTHIITSANQAVHSSEEAKQKMVLHISKTIEHMLYQHRDNRSGRWARFRRTIHQICSFFLMSKRQGTRLCVVYFFIKILYLINSVAQLKIMQQFLAQPSSDPSRTSILFGFEVLKNITLGKDWKSTLIFPRVGFCYVPVKLIGNVNKVVAQCVLPVNMLNEKIYFFLWCWIFISLILVVISIFIWLFRMTLLRSRHGFIYQFLKLNQQIRRSKEEKVMINKFVRQFLRNDGVFLLKMICINTGDLITSDIVCHLWRAFKSHYANRNMLNDGSDAEVDNEDRQLIKLESSDGLKSNNTFNAGGGGSTPSAPYPILTIRPNSTSSMKPPSLKKISSNLT